MSRLLGLVSACVLTAAVVVSGNPSGQAPAKGNPQNSDIQQAREAMQRDVAEGRRLQEELKHDRSAGDKEAVKRDNEALKRNREAVKRDQERIRQLTNGRGGAGRGGRGRGAA